ncbi:hypothetical protein ABBQ38_004978 [Trebouxia sp. C0009 RCD-2024]
MSVSIPRDSLLQKQLAHVCVMRHVLLSLFVACLSVSSVYAFSNKVANTSQVDECGLVKQQTLSTRCQYVKQHCDSDSLINYLRLYFCHAQPAGAIAAGLLLILCVFLLLLLFRVLGSTAENFFSPILTQLSQELGLPPRLAGVTFLALGNGAPDISSSIAAVRAGQYKLALGSLLGGGMFVGCVVAGSVMLACQGAKVRGALIRDVAAYAIAASSVALILWSGKVGFVKACSLLVLYGLFVVLVLAADIHHRIRQVTGSSYDPELLLEQEPLTGGASRSPSPPRAPLDVPLPLQRAHTEREVAFPDARQGWGLQRAHSQPLEQALSYNTLSHMKPRTYRNHAWAQLATSDTFYVRGSPEERALQRRLGLLEEEENAAEDGPPDLEAPGYSPPKLSPARSSSLQSTASDDLDTGPAQQQPAATSSPAEQSVPGQEGTALQAAPLQAAAAQQSRTVSGSFSSMGVEKGVSSGSIGFADANGMHHHHLQGGLDEAQEIAEQVGVWHSLTQKLALLQPVVGVLDKAMDACELPLTVLRRGTIPLLEQESYSKPWFIASLAFGPVMLMLYLESSWLAVLIAFGVGVVAAVGVGYALQGSKEAPTWTFGTDFPVGAAFVAAGGFVIAAMWIDTIASEVVALLEYFGVLSGVDSSILGVTVLAWGNSIGDMATNTAMARKGLGNMAITACYAGPVFNILVGLGLGFLAWIKHNHFGKGVVESVSVELEPTVAAGVFFIVLNSVGIIVIGLINGNQLPAWHGKLMLLLYGMFLVTSVVLVYIR